jgi:hypothetical protein
LHHTDYDGRVINVEFARLPRTDDPDRPPRGPRDFAPRGPPPPPRYPPEPAYPPRYPPYQTPDRYYAPYPPPHPPGPAAGYYDWVPDARDRWSGCVNPRGY